ncbi:hypothetical protein ABIB25_002160 [Nakamurella sp. UYEF19]|uniref:DUF222 domain-containing protein n=1 Tax=Nakamurella sp. UYEF19 TaxID=1756392 RepID=UPI0033909890
MTTVPVDPDSAAAPSGPPAAPTPEPAAAPAAVPVADTFEWVTSAVPAALSPSELPDLIVAANRLISHLQAVQIAAVAEFATPGRCGSMTKLIAGLIDHTGLANRPGGLVDPEAMSVLIAERAQDMAAAEISAALHQSPLGAAHRVSAAVELVEELPATLAALKAGRIDLPRARMIAERTANLDPTLRTAVEAKILPLAETRTPGLLRPMIDLRVIQADPTASKKRADKARKDRFVDHTPSVDGMGMIRAHLTAEGAVAVFDLLDRIAKATVGMDERGIAACRADALVDMCLQILANGFVDLRDTCTPEDSTESDDQATSPETQTPTTDPDENPTGTEPADPAEQGTSAETDTPTTDLDENPAPAPSRTRTRQLSPERRTRLRRTMRPRRPSRLRCPPRLSQHRPRRPSRLCPFLLRRSRSPRGWAPRTRSPRGWAPRSRSPRGRVSACRRSPSTTAAVPTST